MSNIEYNIGYVNDFGWTIIDIFDKDNRNYFKLLCGCGCGEICEVRNYYVSTKDKCNHKLNKNKIIMPRQMTREQYRTRLVGEQFGLLKVIDYYGLNKNNEVLYSCECQCEYKTIINVTYHNLVSCRKDHCGCLTKNRVSNSKKRFNSYDLSGEYGVGFTANTNSEFWFDLEDYDLIKNYCWSEHDGYIISKTKRLHRLVMNVNDKHIKVDHIKHVLYDNRKSQLRICNNQENTMNHITHRNNKSTGISGVTYDAEKSMYRSRIYFHGKTIHLGYFQELKDAVEVRKNAEEKYFGKWSYDASQNIKEI